jgi:hypothetical protein
VKHHDEDIEAKLQRLRRATDPIRPRADFGARVARAIVAEQREGLLVELRRPALRILPALALAAAVSLVWAVKSGEAFDDALSVYADETVELEW